MSTEADKMSEMTITADIEKTRNLDAETTKQRLSKPSTSKENKLEEKKLQKQKQQKPVPPKASFQLILTPYLRTPLEGIPRPTVSFYTPNAHMMYYLVHIMDETIRRNTNFRKQQDDWFPLISRIYFGVIFIIQSLRAQNAVSKLPTIQRNFLNKFLKDYPPESLPLPGPLVTLFESLTPTKPANQLNAFISPKVPEPLGPNNASMLINNDQAHCHQLILPNIPLLIGFTNLITTAPAQAIPDLSTQAAFDNTIGRTMNGHVFTANQWTQTERNALMSAGLLHLVETDSQLNISFNAYGSRLGLPTINGNTEISTTQQYCGMQHSNDWFGRILPIMESYCSYFSGSTSLLQCSKTPTASPLILTTLSSLSAPMAQNNYGHLTHAFPDNTPLTLESSHSTTETDLPPTSAMLAQAAQLNTKFAATQDIGIWNDIGTINVTRTGPYWNEQPVYRRSRIESCYKSYSSIISKHYALSKPPSK